MRVRIVELLKEQDISAYRLIAQSKGRIDPASLYRLVAARGRVALLSSDLLEELCRALDVEPGELLALERRRRR